MLMLLGSVAFEVWPLNATDTNDETGAPRHS